MPLARPEPLAPPRESKSAKHSSRKIIRLLLVDDHPVVRRGLCSCLERQPHLTVVGEAADGQEGLRKARELAPDLVLMDIDMPRLNGLAAAEMLRQEMPAIKVLVLSMYSNADYIMRILESGARGFVLKEAPLEELVRAIEAVQAGETFFSPQIANVALSQFVRGNGPGAQLSNLTGREREVLVAISEGLSNKEIACRLNVGVRTVETHRERIMSKLNIHSVAGLTRFAIQKGLVSLPS